MRTKTHLKVSLVIAVFLVGMAPAIASGGTIYVDADASPGGDGSSWATAYKYLQDALAAAVDGNDIWVAEGTYKPTTGSSRTATFQLINGVAIKGGYAGVGAPDPNQRNVQLYETILNGDLNSDDEPNFVNNSDNSYHVVTGSGTDATAIIDGFTITAGNANGFADDDGGGMFNDNGSPTVTNCTFSGNTANCGGGMYNYNGSNPILTNCTFGGNSAGNWGGGVYNKNSSPTLTNCTFSVNSAASLGGGMYNSGGSPTMTNCTFSGNSAYNGGGMENYQSSPTVTNCIFSGNSANGWAGGGMYNYQSSPMISNCTFSGNSAVDGGGMFNYQNCSPTVTNCTFIRNSSSGSYGQGGGMFNWTSSPTVTNCTFSGNSSSGSYGQGGGMHNRTSSTPTVTNCILWGNTAPSGPQIYNDGTSLLTVTYCDVQGGYTGTGNINADPLFVDATDNLRLSVGSPCIDAGDNTSVPPDTADLDGDGNTIEPIPWDLDGNPRFFDDPATIDTGNGTPPIVDMGAYEYYYEPVTIYVDADASGADDGSSWADAFNYLQDALADANSNPYVNEIWVAQGIYKPDRGGGNAPGDREATFQLKSGVAIKGGYAGVGAPDPNQRNVQLYETILNGDLNSDDEPNFVNNSDNSYHVVTGSGTDATAIIDGFTITAGNASGTWPDTTALGGGMYNSSGSPMVTNCTFSGNSAESGAGMWSWYSSSPTVTNCTFSENSARENGGGMFNFSSSSPTVTNCTFSRNSASSAGGMLNNVSSNPTLTNCTFSGNSAVTRGGGGMTNMDGSSPTVTNCTFSGNSAQFGGGFYNESSNPTLTNCILWGNSAPSGVEIYNVSANPSVTYSDIAGGYTGTGNIATDPLFVDANGLDDIVGTEDDNLHLLGYSPCINAGDPAGDYSGQVDIDGKPRVAYGRVDMGADEVYPAAGDFEPDGDVDFVDFAIFANHWLLGVE